MAFLQIGSAGDVYKAFYFKNMYMNDSLPALCRTGNMTVIFWGVLPTLPINSCAVELIVG